MKEPSYTQRNLVVVRAGDSSLHENWTNSKVAPNWDLIISYFGDDPDNFRNGFGRRIDQKGGKWDGLYRLFSDHPELLDHYDYFWLPDDDIDCCCEDINRIFAAMKLYRVELLQPSLTPNSFFYWFETIQNRNFRLRYSNFIEIMVPCLSAGILRKVLPLMQHTMTGSGLDLVWARLFDDPNYKAAILDEVAVHHTRPVGQVLAVKALASGTSAYDEMLALLGRVRPRLSKKFQRRLHIYRGINHEGRIVKLRPLLAYYTFTGLTQQDMMQSPESKKIGVSRKRLARRIALYRADLSPMQII